MKQRAIKIRIPGEEVIVEGSNAGEMEKGATAAVRRVGVAGVGGGGEIEAGEEGFQGGVSVD